MYAQEFGEHGFGVNPSKKAFALWSKAPNTNKPTLVLQGVEHKEGDAIIKTLADTTTSKVVAISIHVA